MAKKITISFSSNPIVNETFSYKLQLNGVFIPFAGLDETKIIYRTLGTGNSNPYGVEVKATLVDTIEATATFMRSQFSHPSITYTRVGNTLEIFVNIADVLVLNLAQTSASFTSGSVDVPINEELDVKYYFQYTNTIGNVYLCKINQKGHSGGGVEIQGKATLTKGRAKDHLDTIRGTGLDIELEASLDVTLSDLYTEDEQSFTVRFYENNRLIFRGFLKPDGVYESFTRDRWIINLSCVDGLGILANLSFVKSNGLFFVGKMKAFDVIYFCLKRIGIPMKINTSVNIYYTGLTPSDTLDPFQKIYVNADRFVKTDDSTIMSCEDVLKSILDVFTANITQVDGEWYIYRPTELYLNNYPVFRKYTELGVANGIKTIQVSNTLGSQIDNYYPHHCSGNQQKEIKGAINAFRISYKYGYVQGLVTSPNLEHDGNLNYIGWLENGVALPPIVTNDPTTRFGLKVFVQGFPTAAKLLSNEVGILDAGSKITLKVSARTQNATVDTGITFVVKCGAYFLRMDSTWSTTSSSVAFIIDQDFNNQSASFSFVSSPTPVQAMITVEIWKPSVFPPTAPGSAYVIIDTVNILNTFNDTTKIGEFHTVERGDRTSSLIKENKTVYNGDNAGIIYIGAIFKENLIDTTSSWFRRGTFEQFPILRIASEEEIRVAQIPMIVFSGSTFGMVPYLGVTTINNVNGKFMPIDWEFDTMNNICTVKFLQLYCEEIPNIKYNVRPDYGNTVKPTIVG